MTIKVYTYEEIKNNNQKFEEVFQFLRMYGKHTIAYSILQPNMYYFILEGRGVIAYSKYKEKSKHLYVLGDPLAEEKNLKLLLEKFLKTSKHICFMQVSKRVAELLHKEFKFYTSILGTETIIEKSIIDSDIKKDKKINKNIETFAKRLKEYEDEKNILFENMTEPKTRKKFWYIKKKVQKLKKKIKNLEDLKKVEESRTFLDYYLNKKEMAFLRREFNLADKKGIKFKEISLEEIKSEDLLIISNEWINENTLSKEEMVFLTRPFNPEDLLTNNKRLFIIEKDKKIQGFLEVVPIFQEKIIIGFYADIIRTRKDILKGAINYLILKSIEKLFNEGYKIYSLGLSPFHKIKKVYKNELKITFEKNKNIKRIDNRLTTFIFDSIFNYGNFIYNAKGQAFHKERYNAIMVETFFCSNKKIQLREILRGFKICNLSPIKSLKNLFQKR